MTGAGGTTDDGIVHLSATGSVDAGDVGGKAAGLAFLAEHDVTIPPAFAITAGAYRRATDGVAAVIHDELSTVDWDAPVSTRDAVAARIRGHITSVTVPEDLRRAILAAHDQLVDGRAEVAVAVRSSALGEDDAAHSFAGEHDSFLWVRGGDGVLDAVTRCWASLYTARALEYRHDGAIAELPAMAVVVQEMVDATAAGVFMTLNPVNGDRSKVVIEAVWGLGEPLVQGQVDPDRWVVDKITGQVVSRAVATKATALARHERGDGTAVVDVPAERVDAPCLTDEQVSTLVALARRVERAAGSPQDGEFCVARDGRVLTVQSRPETVWSRRDRSSVLQGRDAMSAIVDRLSNPAGWG